MKKLWLMLLLGSLASCCGQKTDETVLTFVDPFIGTGMHGHTYPGATRPYSMVQLSPDTHIIGWDASSGYNAQDSVIYAFSHTHLSGTGIGDLGDVALLPYSGTDSLRPVATFSKSSEKASPGFYGVTLDNFGVDVELTSTERVGFHKYTYRNPADRRVMLDMAHILQPNWGHKVVSNTINLASAERIEGTFRTQGWAHHHSVSYVIVFSEPATKVTVANNDVLSDPALPYSLDTDSTLRVYMTFAESNKPLMVKVSVSPVDVQGADNNMKTELSGWDFAKTHTDSRQIWAEALSKVEIQSADTAVLTNFYTAMYHTMVAPILWQDVDGRYVGMDKQVQTATNSYTNYTAFSLWDTFRALHPLLTIVNPDKAKEFGNVLVQGYREGTILPKWPLASSYTGCMVGYPAVSVLADLATKGLVDSVQYKEWLEASLASSVYRHDLAQKFAGTRELDLITKHTLYKDTFGFVPADSIAESVSWGMEMAYNDWCVAQLAQLAGDTANYAKYMAKSNLYKRYYDAETNFMRGIMANGNFRAPFNPNFSAHMMSDYTEGTAYQWAYFYPHDIVGFMELIGGSDKLEAMLDTLFTASSHVDGESASGDITGMIGQYAHGNEPSHHITYMYNWTQSPHKAQEYLDFIMREYYKPEPAGIIGNEDCGQMSAWYVLSAMGFYQVCPGEPVYTLGRPMVDGAVIKGANGKNFTIKVHNNSATNKYIAEAKLNGVKLEKPFFTHDDIVSGGTLEFFMTDKK